MEDILIKYNYASKSVRTIVDKTGQTWFALIDIANILGTKNSRDLYRNLDEDEKGVEKIYTPGGEQSLQVVNESGLYTLIIRSNSDEAKPFRRWVTHEVLPSIRKNGYYSMLSENDLQDLWIELFDEATKVKNKWKNYKANKTAELWKKKYELTGSEFVIELQQIWGNTRKFELEFQKYMKWYYLQETKES